MRAPFCILAAIAAGAAGCGDDETNATGASGAGANCGTINSPTVLAVSDVEPTGTVANTAIVHAFTVVDAPGLFQMFTFGFGAEHSAGDPDATLSVSGSVDGADIRYTVSPFAWEEAPAEVQMSVLEHYQDGNGCFFSLPSPLFSYSITEGAGGAGGGG